MKPLRVLCVDDHTLLGDVMVRILERAGHHAVFSADGCEGWRQLTESSVGFDVVVTDHEMPGMSGIEMVERMRSVGCPARIVVQSASLTPTDRARYATLDVDAILEKSSSPSALLQAVETAWEKRSASAFASPLPRGK